MSHFERLQADIQQGLSRELIEAIESCLHWEYSASFDAVERRGHSSAFGPSDVLSEISLERHMRNRQSFGGAALTNAADLVGASVEHRLLPNNGQRKVIVGSGPFCFIAETVSEFPHTPRFANYKSELANTYSAIKQLEFDFENGGALPVEWSGRHLGVILHGCHGNNFSRVSTSLSMLRVAFPNSEYDSWHWYADVLNGELHERLGWTEAVKADNVIQVDKVSVTARIQKKTQIKE